MSKIHPTQRNTHDKKAIVTATTAKHFTFKTLVIGVAILALAAGAGYYFTTTANPASAKAAAVVETTSADQISFALTDFSDGKAHYFSYDNNGRTIKYFILKSSDGEVRAAFDACDVCWKAGKGYEQQGDNMVCRNCGRQFASVLINEVQGGCNPAPLTRTIAGNQLVVRVQDIVQGQRYFNF